MKAAEATHRQQLRAQQEVEAAQRVCARRRARRLAQLARPLQALPRLHQLLLYDRGQQAVVACGARGEAHSLRQL